MKISMFRVFTLVTISGLLLPLLSSCIDYSSPKTAPGAISNLIERLNKGETQYVEALEDIPEGRVINSKSIRMNLADPKKIPKDAIREVEQCMGQVSGGINQGQFLFHSQGCLTGIAPKPSLPVQTVVHAIQDIKKDQIVSDNMLQEDEVLAQTKVPMRDLVQCRLEVIGRKAKYEVMAGHLLRQVDFQGKPTATDSTHVTCSKTKVFFAAKDIPVSHQIVLSDVEIRSVHPQDIIKGYISIPFSFLEGRETNQEITKGQVISEKMLKAK